MLAYPDIQILDVTGPLEVFSRTSRWLIEQGIRRDHAYSVEIIGLERGPLTASSGLRLVADRAFHEVGGGLDTLLISGGRGAEQHCTSPELLRWIRRQAKRVRRLGSVCTGAYFLAEAGLLDGRRATTHWASCQNLARRYPRVKVEPDTLFVREGGICTAAGVTAGIDLALAMVEEDHGREIALSVARLLVIFLRRPGGQAQFSAQLASQLADDEPLRTLQAWMADHPGEDLSIERLARRVAMSPRNFSRVFTRQVGTTPARYVASIRVETARRLLEESTQDLEAVSAHSGLGSSESLRRVFLKHVGVSPSQYRQRFSARVPVTGRAGRRTRAIRRVS